MQFQMNKHNHLISLITDVKLTVLHFSTFLKILHLSFYFIFMKILLYVYHYPLVSFEEAGDREVKELVDSNGRSKTLT